MRLHQPFLALLLALQRALLVLRMQRLLLVLAFLVHALAHLRILRCTSDSGYLATRIRASVGTARRAGANPRRAARRSRGSEPGIRRSSNPRMLRSGPARARKRRRAP